MTRSPKKKLERRRENAKRQDKYSLWRRYGKPPSGREMVQPPERVLDVSEPQELRCPDCGAYGRDLETWPAVSLDESWPYEQGRCKVCGAEFKVVPIRCVVRKVE